MWKLFVHILLNDEIKLTCWTKFVKHILSRIVWNVIDNVPVSRSRYGWYQWNPNVNNFDALSRKRVTNDGWKIGLARMKREVETKRRVNAKSDDIFSVVGGSRSYDSRDFHDMRSDTSWGIQVEVIHGAKTEASSRGWGDILFNILCLSPCLSFSSFLQLHQIAVPVNVPNFSFQVLTTFVCGFSKVLSL